MVKSPLIIILSFIFAVLSYPVLADWEKDSEYGWVINPVESWEQSFRNDEYSTVGFASSNEDCILQIQTFEDPDHKRSALQLSGNLSQIYNSDGDSAEYFYNGHKAVFTFLDMNINSTPCKGYMVTIDNSACYSEAVDYPYEYAVFAYTSKEAFDDKAHILLSIINSFSPVYSERLMIGAVDQFLRMETGIPAKLTSLQKVKNPPSFRIRDSRKPLADLDISSIYQSAENGTDEDVESSLDSINRELGILEISIQNEASDLNYALQRYFQMISRDFKYDGRSTAEYIAGRLESNDVKYDVWPAEILSWLQGFSVKQADFFLEVDSIWNCLFQREGTDYSLLMIYISILNHLGFDAILLVDPESLSAIAGVNINWYADSFEYKRRQWVAANPAGTSALGLGINNTEELAGWLKIPLN